MNLGYFSDTITEKKVKKRCTIAVFGADNGSKVCDPWISKKPQCFKNLTNIPCPHGVHCFTNAKA